MLKKFDCTETFFIPKYFALKKYLKFYCFCLLKKVFVWPFSFQNFASYLTDATFGKKLILTMNIFRLLSEKICPYSEKKFLQKQGDKAILMNQNMVAERPRKNKKKILFIGASKIPNLQHGWDKKFQIEFCKSKLEKNNE